MKKFNKENVQNGLNEVYKKIKEIKTMTANDTEYIRAEAAIKELTGQKIVTEKEVILHLITYELENVNLKCNIPFND